MKKLKTAFVAMGGLAILMMVQAFSGKNGPKDEFTYLTVVQGDYTVNVRKEKDTIHLKKREFAIQFINKRYDPTHDKFYAAQVSMALDTTLFWDVSSGMNKKDVPVFKSGSGLAVSGSGMYDAVVLDRGHHYLFYENEKNKRVNLLSGKIDLLLEWPIKVFKIAGKKTEVERTAIDTLYMAAYIDRDLNGYIEKGELSKVMMVFE